VKSEFIQNSQDQTMKTENLTASLKKSSNQNSELYCPLAQSGFEKPSLA